MTKNDGREFATMTEEERRRFALEHGGAAPEDAGDELDLEDPRDPDKVGRHYGSLKEEIADPDARDGTAALLDDEEHKRRIEEEERKSS
jgi:hypothetical protein